MDSRQPYSDKVAGLINKARDAAPEPQPAPVEGFVGFQLSGSQVEVPSPDRVMLARDSTTSSASFCNGSADECNEKPAEAGDGTAILVGLSIVIPAVIFIALFVFLQRRHNRKQREEELNDRHASMDFGLGDVPKRSGPPSTMNGSDLDMMEKGPSRHAYQKSLEIDVESPYLLPPELQNSRESLHSLSRSIHQNEDPYRPVAQYTDGQSIRSFSKSRYDGDSIRTGSSGAPSRMENGSERLITNAARMSRSNPPVGFPPRMNSMPKSATSTVSPVEAPTPVPRVNSPANILDRSPSPALQEPLPSNVTRKPLAVGQGQQSSSGENGNGSGQTQNYLGNLSYERQPSAAPKIELPAIPTARKPLPPALALPSNPNPQQQESQGQIVGDDDSDYGDGFKVTPPSPTKDAERIRGQRYSMDVPPEEFVKAGLGAPGFDAKRLSMGFRPLPPDAGHETEDPETRANRIRSFYKEYFDDSKPAPAGQYYEDYDQNYLGDAAYYDPNSNNFVMPYAEPVTRRAMTPPPRASPGPRFPGGPRGAPPRHGSMGGPNAGPRAYSSASQRPMPGGAPKKPLPPPEDLSSLPTPAKLRDDSFALMNSLQFAPPTSVRDRQAGRSDSPLGARRPYSPAVPAFTPLQSAWDELNPMPSPHLLRKSGTFTALDFAPPRKFKDPENASDAGSIRSNRSNLSAAQVGAIRNGAYRVSRLPTSQVATKDDMASQLKPQWGMRVGDGLQ